jgi:hypothetical protein
VVGCSWLVERRRPSALATRRFSVSPPLRLPKSSSLLLLDSSATLTTEPPPQRHERHLNLSTTNPLRPAGSPSPLPVLLPLEKGRGDTRLALVSTSTPPRRPASPFPRLPRSLSRRLFPSSIHRHHLQPGRTPRHEHIFNPSTTNPSVSPVPHPLLLSFSLWRRDVGPSVSVRVRTSTPPRRPASPFPRLPRPRPRRLFPSSIHRHHPQRGRPPCHEHTLHPSTTKPLCPSASPAPRLPGSPTLSLIDSSAKTITRPPSHAASTSSTPAPPRTSPSPNLRQKSGEVLGSGASVVGTRQWDDRIEPVRALVVALAPARQSGAAPGSLRDGRTP